MPWIHVAESSFLISITRQPLQEVSAKKHCL